MLRQVYFKSVLIRLFPPPKKKIRSWYTSLELVSFNGTFIYLTYKYKLSLLEDIYGDLVNLSDHFLTCTRKYSLILRRLTYKPIFSSICENWLSSLWFEIFSVCYFHARIENEYAMLVWLFEYTVEILCIAQRKSKCSWFSVYSL